MMHEAQVTGRDAYTALKQWHPQMIDNLEACVNSGAQADEILAKTKEFTPVEAPDFLWDYIKMALDYLVLERNTRLRTN